MAAITVLLVDDQRLLREGLRTLLSLHDDLRIVGEAADGIEAEHLVELLRPAVVLMDLRMPRRDGVAATRAIRARFPATRVLVLTTFDDSDLVLRSLEAGACGYLLKDMGSNALAEAVRAAVRDEAPLDPGAARALVRHLQAAAPATATGDREASEPLTARELDVLRLLGTGATNRSIAEHLSLSEGTVKNYISSILAKTGLHDRTQAALYAVHRGIL